MIRQVVSGLLLICSAFQALAWTDGELLVWIGEDKGHRGLAEVAQKFEKEVGLPVKVEAPGGLTDTPKRPRHGSEPVLGEGIRHQRDV